MRAHDLWWRGMRLHCRRRVLRRGLRQISEVGSVGVLGRKGGGEDRIGRRMDRSCGKASRRRNSMMNHALQSDRGSSLISHSRL